MPRCQPKPPQERVDNKGGPSCTGKIRKIIRFESQSGQDPGAQDRERRRVRPNPLPRSWPEVGFKIKSPWHQSYGHTRTDAIKSHR